MFTSNNIIIVFHFVYEFLDLIIKTFINLVKYSISIRI